MNKLIGLALIVVLATNAAAEEDDKLTLGLSTKVWSKYLFISGVVYHDEPVAQTDLFVGLPKGFYADLWWSVGLDGTDASSDFGDEIDYTVGWAGSFGKLDVDLGIAYFDSFELFDTGGDGDVLQPYIELSKTLKLGEKHKLTPYTAFQWQQPLKSSMSNGGYLIGGVSDLFQISPKVSVNSKVGVLYDTGAYNYDNGLVGFAKLEASWQLTKKFSMQLPSIMATKPISTSDERKTQVAFGLGLSIDF